MAHRVGIHWRSEGHIGLVLGRPASGNHKGRERHPDGYLIEVGQATGELDTLED